MSTETKGADWFARIVAALSILISLYNTWQTLQTRQGTFPSIGVHVELVDGIALKKPLFFKVVLENRGPTAARGVKPDVHAQILPANAPFVPEFIHATD